MNFNASDDDPRFAPPALAPDVLWCPPMAPSVPAYRFPSPDEHLVQPEVTRDEMIRGRKVVAMPAAAPHADRQTKLDALIDPHIHHDWVGSTELLTRVSEGSDFATDLSIRRKGNDPATGHRYLEELAFEVVNEQKMKDIREKAEDMTARGVRRVFAIFVKKEQVGEWSAKDGNFVMLSPDSFIKDPCFVKPIPVRALLDPKLARSEAVRAYEHTKEPAILEIKAKAERRGERRGQRKGLKLGLVKGKREGLEEGLTIGRNEGLEIGQRQVVLRLLSKKFGQVPGAAQLRVQDARPAELDVWVERVLSAATIEQVFAEPV